MSHGYWRNDKPPRLGVRFDYTARMDRDLIQAVNEEMALRKKQQEDRQFKQWCEELDRVPARYVPKLKGQNLPDMELQPRRWLGLGMSIFESAHVAGRVRLMDGREGDAISAFLPYPVFQMGAEIFLKGMMLCRFEKCRGVAYNTYVQPRVRRAYFKRVKTYGHDLMKIMRHLRRIGPYRQDTVARQFLRRVEAVVRYYYHPLYAADRGSWTAARYPKRFYDDQARTAGADAYQSYPDQRLVLRLFSNMERYLDDRWQITRELARRPKA